MKVVLKNVIGSSPGLIVIGERESLLELASSLRSKVEEVKPDHPATIPWVGCSPFEGHTEWIGLQVVSDLRTVVEPTERKSRRSDYYLGAALLFAVCVLGLAFLGILSIFR